MPSYSDEIKRRRREEPGIPEQAATRMRELREQIAGTDEAPPPVRPLSKNQQEALYQAGVPLKQNVGAVAASRQTMEKLEAMLHTADCAQHNAPAIEPKHCDCGARVSTETIAAEIAAIADQLPPDKLASAIECYLDEVR